MATICNKCGGMVPDVIFGNGNRLTVSITRSLRLIGLKKVNKDER